MKFPCGSDRWTIAVTRDEVSGTTEGSCPPFVWSGTFGGRLSSGRALQITQLHYEQGTTHSDHETLRLSGSLTVDHVGIAGRLDGEYSTFETFGSARGPTRSCQAFAVPVRFTPLR